MRFSFGRILSVPVQEEVFAEVGGVVQSALDGYRVCIFAYGQTGTPARQLARAT